jgi:hypothetical protein
VLIYKLIRENSIKNLNLGKLGVDVEDKGKQLSLD